MHVAVGQVWADKDKRRPRKGEVISIEDNYVTMLIVGTEKEAKVRNDVLLKRWTHEVDKSYLENKKATPKNWQLKAVCTVSEYGQSIRLTRTQAEKGDPLCGCHHKPMKIVETH